MWAKVLGARSGCKHCAAIIAILLGAALTATAQSTEDDQRIRAPFTLIASAHSGSIIAHSRKLIDVSGSRPYGVEVDADWLMNDERYTRRSGLVARRGFALHAIDFNNSAVLGRMISLTPYVEPMIRAQDRLHGSVRVGAGFAYLNKVYDAQSNPTNLFFSTRISFTAMVCAYLGYRIGPHWEVKGGFNFNHISNGGLKEPNKGMNFPTWSLGVAHCFTPVSLARPVRDDAWKVEARHRDHALLSGSVKNLAATDGHPSERTTLFGALVARSWRTGRLTTLWAGTEWVYDGHARALLDRLQRPTSAWRGALVAGPGMLSGRVHFSFLFGGYVYHPARNTDVVYQRYQLLYHASDHITAGVSLKAHRHVADVFDLRIGWSW